MRLALKLGRPDVDAMLAGMSVEQLVEWRAFELLEPFGGREAERRMAMLCATMVNLWSKNKAGIDNFMRPEPEFGTKPTRSAWLSAMGSVENVAEASGSAVSVTKKPATEAEKDRTSEWLLARWKTRMRD